MARHSDTRQRMLNAAAELFRSQGYHATGLNQLLAAGDLPKGSLYFHFPGGKEQLAAEAITLASTQRRDTLRTLVSELPDAASGVEAVVHTLAQGMLNSDFQHGCPLATVALDIAADSELIRQSCVDGYNSWHDVLAEYFVTHGLSTARAANLSIIVLASVEGGLLLAKTQKDIAPLHTIAEHLRATIEREFASCGSIT